MVATTSSEVVWVCPRARMSAITLSALRVSLLRASMASRPSWIANPSQSASVIGKTIAQITTSLRSRGEIRSQKSRVLSLMVDIVSLRSLGSLALRSDRELELADAVFAALGRAAVDLFVEAFDLLE